MATLRTYKFYVAVILLAVYGFIATPVQVWHHHKATGRQEASNSKSVMLAKSTGTSADADCSICSHQYSSYYDDNVSPVLPVVAIYPTQKGDVVFSVTLSPVFNLSNKGPPALS